MPILIDPIISKSHFPAAVPASVQYREHLLLSDLKKKKKRQKKEKIVLYTVNAVWHDLKFKYKIFQYLCILLLEDTYLAERLFAERGACFSTFNWHISKTSVFLAFPKKLGLRQATISSNYAVSDNSPSQCPHSWIALPNPPVAVQVYKLSVAV